LDYQDELVASDVIGLMDYLKIRKAAIVGWSDEAILGPGYRHPSPGAPDKLLAFGAGL